MAALTHLDTFHSLVCNKGLILPPAGAQERRRGALERFEVCKSRIQRDLSVLPDLAQKEKSEASFTRTYTRLSMEICSLLYAAGSGHDEWRYWAALTATGYFWQNKLFDAAQFAAISYDWTLTDWITERWTPKNDEEHAVRAALTGDQSWLQSKGATSDTLDAQLTSAFLHQDYEATQNILVTESEFWKGEASTSMFGDGDDFLDFRDRTPPDFEPLLCAYAALLICAGHNPAYMPTEYAAFLEPGFAVSGPHHFFDHALPKAHPGQ